MEAWIKVCVGAGVAWFGGGEEVEWAKVKIVLVGEVSLWRRIE